MKREKGRAGDGVDQNGHGQRVVIAKEESPQLNAAACIKCTFCEAVCFYDAIKAPPRTTMAGDNRARARRAAGAEKRVEKGFMAMRVSGC